ncbi:metallophosphoesterase family protein [Bacillus sp. FJAT-49736]|uniref:metallophosphoesterase family protein n=1 Tax=Bacillus sp. FJAT-49736 TaxID=2833582 RepID=UPI001BC8DB0D|nr:metallophosphoesterase family protein [Bacillus sp. FJAT-49736]MBS4173160.1 serine/threonine protein phosphatase [Bacillus sp. FJAT-49736]
MDIIDKRILVISDIHGCLKEFQELLNMAEFNPNLDQLILLGDYVDRGKYSKAVVRYIKELVENFGVIALRGNHDQMFCDWLDEPIETLERYFRNGGLATIQSFLSFDIEREIPEGSEELTYRKWAEEILAKNKELIDFLANLPFYYETDEYIFVHAGINPNYDDWKNTSEYEFIWIRDPFLHFDHPFDQTIIHGHTPTYILHNDPNIFYGNKKIGIDGACVYGHQLNCLEIKDGNYTHYCVKKEEEYVDQES